MRWTEAGPDLGSLLYCLRLDLLCPCDHVWGLPGGDVGLWYTPWATPLTLSIVTAGCASNLVPDMPRLAAPSLMGHMCHDFHPGHYHLILSQQQNRVRFPKKKVFFVLVFVFCFVLFLFCFLFFENIQTQHGSEQITLETPHQINELDIIGQTTVSDNCWVTKP